MPSRKSNTILAVSAASTLLVGGAVYALWKRSAATDETECVAFTKVDVSKQQKNREGNHFVDKKSVVHKKDGDKNTNSTEMIPADEETLSGQGVHVFDKLGLIMKLTSDWRIAEDIAPMPNVAMITLQHNNYSYDTEGMPGKAPVLIISVEDVSFEKLNEFEFKEKSKAIAIRQMYAMTGGMIEPKISFDGPEEHGYFKMKLQYSMISPMIQLQVANFITVKNDLAYVIQLMASPDVFSLFEKDVKTIAERIQITNIPTHPTSHTKVHFDDNRGHIDIPVSWVVTSLHDDLMMETPCPTKPDVVKISVVKNKKFTRQDLVDACTLEIGSTFTRSCTEKYMEATYIKDKCTIQLCASEDMLISVTPMRTSTMTVTMAELHSIIDSFKKEESKDKKGMIYHNRRFNFSFEVQPNSRLVESRVGDTAITFAPEGIITDPSSTEPKPLLTIRVGDPSTDADCESTVEGWMIRMEHELTLAAASTKDLRFETINGHRCVTFSERQMQETMTGQEEYEAKVIVFVEDGQTYMLRWEVAANMWKLFEKKLFILLGTFNFNTTKELL